MTNKIQETLINKTILVGITYLDSNYEIVDKKTFCGIIKSVNNDSIDIRINRTGEIFSLPPDVESIKEAQKGCYHIYETGEKILNPDYVSMWEIVCSE